MAVASPCWNGVLVPRKFQPTPIALFSSPRSPISASSLSSSCGGLFPASQHPLISNSELFSVRSFCDGSSKYGMESKEKVWGVIASRSNLVGHRRLFASTGGGDGGEGGSSGGGGGGGDNDGGDQDADGDKEKNKSEAFAALASLKLDPKFLPADLGEAIKNGKIPASVIKRFAGLQESAVMRYLMQFGGFKERLLADDLFLTKVGIECGVGIFTKTAAEYERRREKFFEELDFVIADVAMALVADFMLVWLPAPTVSLQAPLAANVGRFQKFLMSCPDNAFQVPLRGTYYTLLQRITSILRNGTKLLAVGTVASLFGTAATNGLIYIRKELDKGKTTHQTHEKKEGPEVKILETSLAYGVYMAISSNLRYQLLAGVVEQRILEPLFHDKKLLLSVLSFIARTGNTFLGSLLWVDYARFVGVQ